MIYLKKIAATLILLSIIPLSLYINFFIFKLTTWSYVIKAWLIYSSLVIISNIMILFIVRKILVLLILKFKIPKGNFQSNFINITSIAFLLGNIFFTLAIYRARLWYYVPIFQGLIVFLFGIKFIKQNFINNNNLPLIEQLFTIKKSRNKNDNINKPYIILLISIILYISLSSLFQFTIYKSYNPLRKSLVYYMEEIGYKVKS